MIIKRTDNAVKNIFYGTILRIYQIIIPFIMRTALIHFLGVEYLGLDGLFISILQVLNLAELGVGAAMVYSMYKPIAEDDSKKISALMNLYKKYYNIIGSVMLIVGLAITPFVQYLVKSDVPREINLTTIYILNLIATVLSYWLFAYKNSIFQAHQRVDIISKVTLGIKTLQYIFQFVILFVSKNYYLYLIIYLLSQLINNIVVAILADKIYPNYKPTGKLDDNEIKELKNKIKDLFVTKIGGVIVNSADTIVISAFLGLTVLAIYQNYYYIMTAVVSLIAVIYTACMAGIGNSIVVETPEKNYKDFKVMTFITQVVSVNALCLLMNLYQPFIELWVGAEYMFNNAIMICFCIYFFIYEYNSLLNMYKDSAGLWKKDKKRVLVTAFLNLGLNLLLVNFIGVYGILLSTIFSMLCVGMPWLISNLFEDLFKTSPREYKIIFVKNLVVAIVVGMFNFVVCSCINTSAILTLVIRGILTMIITNVLLLMFYGKTDEFSEAKKIVRYVLKRGD